MKPVPYILTDISVAPSADLLLTNTAVLNRRFQQFKVSQLLLLSLVVGLITSTGLMASEPKAAPIQATPVEVVSAHYAEYAKAIRISGLLENKSEQSLGFKVSGLVSRVYVDEGQFVKKGQLLASLDLEEIDAEVAKAKSVLANAQRNLERFQSLQGQNALSMDQLQSAKRAWK